MSVTGFPIVGDRVPLGRFFVHSRFSTVINYVRGDRLVSLVTQKVGPGPTHIVLGEKVCVSSLDPIEITKENIVCSHGSWEQSQCSVYNSELHFEASPMAMMCHCGAELCANLAPLYPAKSLGAVFFRNEKKGFEKGFENNCLQQLELGARILLSGDYLRGVKYLRGTGIGLTPTGDDFLCGYMYALQFLQHFIGKNYDQRIREVATLAMGSNIFSNSAFSLAQNGYFSFYWKSFLESLGQCDYEKARKCAVDISGIGSSSGSDALAGFFKTIKEELKW